jgi:hypothetical protein
MEADSDDRAVMEAVIAWMNERNTEQTNEYNEINARFTEEFARRQKEKEEQAWFAAMDKEQKAVDKLWNGMNALHEQMNTLHERESMITDDNERLELIAEKEKLQEKIQTAQKVADKA